MSGAKPPFPLFGTISYTSLTWRKVIVVGAARAAAETASSAPASRRATDVRQVFMMPPRAGNTERRPGRLSSPG